MTKGEETRNRIVHEAALMFNTRGFAGSCMLDLMTATGLEKGGLYRHFDSKEQIAAAAFRHAWQQVMEARWRHLDSIASPRRRLLQLITNFIEVRSPIPGGCPLLNTATDADDGNPVLRELAREALADWKARVAALIQAAIRAGELPRTVHAGQLANVIIATLEGAVMMTRLEHSRRPLEDARLHLHTHIASLAGEVPAREAKKPRRNRAASGIVSSVRDRQHRPSKEGLKQGSIGSKP
jgi:TetR/AcrR family transcriptional repressor of nem operon